MASTTKIPDDLVDVGPGGYATIQPTKTEEKVATPSDMVQVDPDYVKNQVDLLNPVTKVAAAGAAARPLVKKVLGMNEQTSRQSLETYLKSQIHHKYPGLNLDALEKEVQKMYGPQARVSTMAEVQAGLNAVQGPVFGQPTVDLSPYSKNILTGKTRAGQGEMLLKSVGENINPITGQGFGAKTMRTAGRGVIGGAAGVQGASAYNRAQEGDAAGAATSGMGALGAALMTSRNPKFKGAGAILQGLSLPGQFMREEKEGYKKGGLVYLAGGKRALVEEGVKKLSTKMSPGMSFGKASDETAQPSGRLVSSLANKFGYDEAKLAQDYPQTLFPILEKDKRTGNLFAGKATHPEAEAIKKARMFAQEEIKKGDYEPYFDITKRAYVDPAQYPLSGNTLKDAIPKTPDTIAKYEAIAKNPDALAQWQKGFDTGSQRPLAKDWYAMKQLQDEYVRVLGPKEGIKQFKARFADAMGATTGGADPTSNLMTAAYSNVMRQRGMDIPTEGFDVPYPVYGRFLGQNLEQAKKLHETGGLSASTQPKRHNFSGNFLGHRDLSTLDEQMMSAYLDPKKGSAYTSPPGGAYGLFQRELNNLADKNQVMPANFQDVTWAGLKDYPGKPMMQEINELLHRTSRIGGMTQKEALENLIRADKPVYKKGGSTTPAWQRSEGKSPSGGLNALGRASYKRETGGELKAPQPEGGSRKKSFCARMGGMKKKLTSSETANDPDSRINKALRKWKC